jgi:glutathione synthase/RimK-type ligase-like ATP-grasp enzyme
LIKIGIIIDKYHLQKKSLKLVEYLSTIAKISLYLEEDYLIDYSNFDFNEDIFFVKAKSDLILNLVKLIERETDIPVINSSRGIWLAINRFLNSTLLRQSGIQVPNFSLNAKGLLPLFSEYIIKNIIDQKNYAFKAQIKKINGHLKVADKRALDEVNGEKAKYTYLYYQEFIKSKWEYKIYCIGDDLFYYKQLPILIEPDKMKSRMKIREIPELTEIAIKAVKTVGLKIASIDFLKSKKGEFFLTDINSSPNFNYIKNGPKIIGDYLIKQAKN